MKMVMTFTPKRNEALSAQEAILEPVRQAQQLLAQDRAVGLARLHEIFRLGSVPSPALQGRYRGELVALDIAPILTPLFTALTRWWLPWQGKRFDAAASLGDNLFSRDVLPLSYVLMPFYRGRIPDTPTTFRAFTFRTYIAPGLSDPAHEVLKIDYNLPQNPALNVRRVMDELVEIGDGVYLGQAHVRWWWGTWQLVAYFALTTA
jgi:hypothetical protein